MQTDERQAAGYRDRSVLPRSFERPELYDVLDRYLAALKAKKPERAPWADVVRSSQNNVAMEIGDGLWGTIGGLGSYDLRFADLTEGQVGFFGAVEEAGDRVPYALRLKVTDGRIAEVEEIVARKSEFFLPFPAPVFEDKAILNEVLAPERRRPRARMISVADGYFDTLQLNDGALFAGFAEGCNRFENGVQMTNRTTGDLLPITRLGCAAQFELGFYRYIDRLRARRFSVIDEERGLVLASGFIDHRGRPGKYPLTDGRIVEPLFLSPNSMCMQELFKIGDGKIEQVEAVYISVPYNMASPWPSAA